MSNLHVGYYGTRCIRSFNLIIVHVKERDSRTFKLSVSFKISNYSLNGDSGFCLSCWQLLPVQHRLVNVLLFINSLSERKFQDFAQDFVFCQTLRHAKSWYAEKRSTCCQISSMKLYKYGFIIITCNQKIMFCLGLYVWAYFQICNYFCRHFKYILHVYSIDQSDSYAHYNHKQFNNQT